MSDIVVSSQKAVNPFRAESLESAWRISEGLSKSELVPEIYRNKPFNVMIAIMCSQDLGVNPFTVMQHMSVIKGKPRWEVKFLIAMANKSGVFSKPIDWEVTGSGDTLTAKAFATLKASGVTVSCSVSLAEAKADGWANNPKYKSIPELMLRYRSAGRLIDLYCPEVRLGLSDDAAPDESEESQIVETPPPPPTVAVLPPAEKKKTLTRSRKPVAEAVAQPKTFTAPAVIEQEETAPAVSNLGGPDNAAINEEITELQQRQREVAEELFAIQADPKRFEAEQGRRAQLIEEREEIKGQIAELRSQLQ